MSGSEKKSGKTLSESVSPSVEFEKILSRLGTSRETIKEVERTIEAPDARTRITYSVEVDPRTGAQKVIEKFSTTMQQCSICLNYVPQIFRCEAPNCGALVCATDKRVASFAFWSPDPNKYHFMNVCASCYEAGLKKQKDIDESYDRSNRTSRELTEMYHRHSMDWSASGNTR